VHGNKLQNCRIINLLLFITTLYTFKTERTLVRVRTLKNMRNSRKNRREGEIVYVVSIPDSTKLASYWCLGCQNILL
jgi:hypothetical protein